MRCPGGSNTGATKPNSTTSRFYSKKSNSTRTSRTVSKEAARYRIAHKGAQNQTRPYFLTVTLNVPTLPLLSNVRREIVCSPGPRCPKSIE